MASDLTKSTIKVAFNIERETKGAVRYQEVDDSGNPKNIADGAVIGTMYLRKSQLVGIPQKLVVTITTPD